MWRWIALVVALSAQLLGLYLPGSPQPSRILIPHLDHVPGTRCRYAALDPCLVASGAPQVARADQRVHPGALGCLSVG